MAVRVRETLSKINKAEDGAVDTSTTSMARTHGKIAKLEATVASLRQDYQFLQEKVKIIEGKNGPLEAKVKALMDKNQNLQIKMLGKMDTLRDKASRDQQADTTEKS